MYGLALALPGDQDPIGILVGAQVGQTEIQHIPAQHQAVGFAAGICRNRIRRGIGSYDSAVVEYTTARGCEAIPLDIACVGCELRQHVEARHSELACRHRRFHQLNAAFAVVQQRPVHLFFERHALSGGLNCFSERLLVVLPASQCIAEAERYRDNGASSQCQSHRECGEASRGGVSQGAGGLRVGRIHTLGSGLHVQLNAARSCSP